MTPRLFRDDRGVFAEEFVQESLVGSVGHPLALAQVNCSTSRRGVIRGIHCAAVPPGQAKYVSCQHGAVLDVVVDLRVGSPMFGAFATVPLHSVERRSVYIAEGLGHAFAALSEEATVSYLCSTPYAPEREFGVNPLDPAIGVPWGVEGEPILSPKDLAAPTLGEAEHAGLLPGYADCRALYASLRDSAGHPAGAGP
ncbi:dTDP-4-dehydrorhamnose 3,5-epimerase family protein [Streptomyces sp. ISL-98]|uniref:dTDP-4-dehydrorhamnose 3,5-epimerase family protein n=1 Tax=Streptomyces sp. ISL-98 TaxID=2819192 RepID=UPI001BE61F84|nr:dTDP-4-dehydrorhamnose 3,5-epimerase [Streptomyces sp. ISL-98]MBT2508903.1 dTDP-4-dehydrorhamnose 3,5-epimerase family protein [Streptomyces sp. ISL-98]